MTYPRAGPMTSHIWKMAMYTGELFVPTASPKQAHLLLCCQLTAQPGAGAAHQCDLRRRFAHAQRVHDPPRRLRRAEALAVGEKHRPQPRVEAGEGLVEQK